MNKPIRIKPKSQNGETDIFILKEGKGMCCCGEIEICQGQGDERNKIRFNESQLKQIISALSGEIPELTELNQKDFMRESELYLMKSGSYDVYTERFFEREQKEEV